MNFLWIKLFLVLAKLTLEVWKVLERKRLIDQVQRDVVDQLRTKADEFIGDIDATIGNVSSSPDDILLDPANRDREGSGDADQKGTLPRDV